MNPETDIRIRPWGPADAPHFLKLYQDVFPEKHITEYTLKNIQDEPATVLLAETGSGDRCELAGFLYYWTILDEIQIIDLGVSQAWRRHGIGAKLLWTLIGAASREWRTIRLEVRATNRAAIGLYERMAFLKEGVRRSYYWNGEDAVLYSFRPG